MTAISVQSTSQEQTNLLLRALWAAVRSEFGKLAWQFTPYRDGERREIWFGFADVGEDESISFGVKYAQRGVATHICTMRWGRRVGA